MRCGNKPRTAKQRAITYKIVREKKKSQYSKPNSKGNKLKNFAEKTQKTQAIGANKKKKNLLIKTAGLPHDLHKNQKCREWFLALELHSSDLRRISVRSLFRLLENGWTLMED